jgi:hypothetical protein
MYNTVHCWLFGGAVGYWPTQTNAWWQWLTTCMADDRDDDLTVDNIKASQIHCIFTLWGYRSWASLNRHLNNLPDLRVCLSPRHKTREYLNLGLYCNCRDNLLQHKPFYSTSIAQVRTERYCSQLIGAPTLNFLCYPWVVAYGSYLGAAYSKAMMILWYESLL